MLVALAWAALAGPPEPGLVVQWTAPAGCPDGAEVRARVVRLVGEEAARKARLTARAAVRSEGGRWALDLELVGEAGGGRRALAAGKCGELAGAAALVIAIAVDPRAALASEGEGPGADEVVPPPPGGGAGGTGGGEGGEVAPGTGGGERGGEVAPRTGGGEGGGGAVGTGGGGAPGSGGAAGSGGSGDMSAESVAGDSGGMSVETGDGGVRGETELPGQVAEKTGSKGQGGEAARRVRVGLRAAAGVSFARILPASSAALSLAVSVAGRGWRAELAGLYAPPVVGGSPQIGGVFQVGAVELRGCPAWTRGRFEVPLCAGLQIGGMQGRGRGSGLAVRETARSLWLAASLGAALAWRPRERVGLWLQVDGLVALVRPSFVTAGGVLVHEAARFGGQALAGIEVRLR